MAKKKDISKKIRKIMAEGKSYPQAVAIALSMLSKKRTTPRPKPKRGGRTQTNKRKTKR